LDGDFLNTFDGNGLGNIDPSDNGDVLSDNLFNRNWARDLDLLDALDREGTSDLDIDLTFDLVWLRNLALNLNGDINGTGNLDLDGNFNSDLAGNLDGDRDIDGNLAGNLDGDRDIDGNLAGNLDRDRNINGDVHRHRDVHSDLDRRRLDFADDFNRVRDVNRDTDFLGNGNADRNVVRDVDVLDAFNVVRNVDANFNGDGNINGNVDGNRDGDRDVDRDINRDGNVDANFDRVGASYGDLARNLDRSGDLYSLGNIDKVGNLARNVNRALLWHSARDDLFDGDRNGARNRLDLLNRNKALAGNNLFQGDRHRHLDIIGNRNGNINKHLNIDWSVDVLRNILVHSGAPVYASRDWHSRSSGISEGSGGNGVRSSDGGSLDGSTVEGSTHDGRSKISSAKSAVGERAGKGSTWEPEGLCSDSKD